MSDKIAFSLDSITGALGKYQNEIVGGLAGVAAGGLGTAAMVPGQGENETYDEYVSRRNQSALIGALGAGVAGATAGHYYNDYGKPVVKEIKDVVAPQSDPISDKETAAFEPVTLAASPANHSLGYTGGETALGAGAGYLGAKGINDVATRKSPADYLKSVQERQKLLTSGLPAKIKNQPAPALSDLQELAKTKGELVSNAITRYGIDAGTKGESAAAGLLQKSLKGSGVGVARSAPLKFRHGLLGTLAGATATAAMDPAVRSGALSQLRSAIGSIFSNKPNP